MINPESLLTLANFLQSQLLTKFLIDTVVHELPDMGYHFTPPISHVVLTAL